MSAVFETTSASQKVEKPPHIVAYTRAKIALMLKEDAIFFTSVLFSLKHLWSDEISTACTDGTQIVFNPNFFLDLTQEERVFLMLHEALHVALLHMDRLNERDHAIWNKAADHVINLMLIERGFKMPQGGLADPRFKNMSSEQVYAVLKQEENAGGPGQNPGSGNAPGDFGSDLMPSTGNSQELREQVNDILVRAAIRAKQESGTPGSIPGQFQVYLDKLLNPKLPWQRILQKFMHSMDKSDYSFKRPNRRFFPSVLLPSLYSESLNHLAIAVDTSGSVTDAEFTRFVSEITGIFRMLRPKKITLVQFDTAIKETADVKDLVELSKVKFIGRGGTRIAPLLDWTNEHKPQVMLVFTDGEFRWPTETTKVPLIWLIHNNPGFVAPIGKTIHYEATT